MNAIQSWDARRDYFIAEDAQRAAIFTAEHWIHAAKRSIQQHGRFAVALSGGSAPKAIYQLLSQNYKEAIDWKKVFLFWSDERAVAPDHPDSNYKMALESGFKTLPIPPHQIFRMKAESDISKHAADYEDLIHRLLGEKLFDLVMLGVGEDGHTASLFPQTEALREEKKLVTANWVSEKNCWRMTLTFPCIHRSAASVVYCIGSSKEAILPLVLRAAIHSPFPASAVGTEEHKALWILDKAAAHLLF